MNIIHIIHLIQPHKNRQPRHMFKVSHPYHIHATLGSDPTPMTGLICQSASPLRSSPSTSASQPGSCASEPDFLGKMYTVINTNRSRVAISFAETLT